MPVWTYCYLVIVVVCAIFSICTNKPKSAYQITGESLSVISCLGLFLISYGVVVVSQPLMLSTVFLVFMIAWSIWECRNHYSFYLMPASEFAKTVELGEDETLEDAALSIKILKYGSLVLIALISLPVFYVYAKVVVNGN